MSYSIDSLSDGCYEGTTCLINKFDIHEETQLKLVESHITLAKISMLEQNPIKGKFDFEHYKMIHRFIFEDIYDWAGEIRTVNISKNGTYFAKAAEINEIANACFRRLKEENYFTGLPTKEFIESVTDFYCVTNNLHPFREGNGRTQRVFLAQLAFNAGYELNFSFADVDGLMIATIQASHGVYTYIKEIMSELIRPIKVLK